jgi:hypothetical protein
MRRAISLCVVMLGLSATAAAQLANDQINTVFIILMENHDWSQIKDSPQAPYINDTLLPMSSYAEQYFNPPGIHPSLPNYLWLEAGDNFGIFNDAVPAVNHQSTTSHLVSLLENAGLTWKSYQEDITGTVCPLTNFMGYAPKHNPMVYFDDVTDTNDSTSPHCIDHVRPYTELETDLANDTVARYNFITPNLCNDMHDCGVDVGDTWLSNEVPKILNSPAYQNGGALFVTWDEGEGGSDGPVGFIALSPFAKGNGYSNTIYYTHSSTLRTVQTIFGLSPLLGDADNAADLSDLFVDVVPGTRP